MTITFTAIVPAKLDASWSHPLVWVPLADILAGDSVDGISWFDMSTDWTNFSGSGAQAKRNDYGPEAWQRFLDELAGYGLRHPVMWNPVERTLANGHHRVIAAYDLGWTDIPVVLYGYGHNMAYWEAWDVSTHND